MRACLAVLACSLPAAFAGTNAFGKKFLEENKAREGVITLPSGLQYKVLRDGDGERHPLPDTSCECHYEGRSARRRSGCLGRTSCRTSCPWASCSTPEPCGLRSGIRSSCRGEGGAHRRRHAGPCTGGHWAA